MPESIEPNASATKQTGVHQAPSEHVEPAWLRLCLACTALAILIWQVNHYAPFFSDDGFISLRYSQRLLEGQGLTWTDGERVEGYSNLSYVLLSALFGWVLQDLVLAARCVGFLGVAFMARALWISTGKGRLKVSTLLSWNLLVSIASVTVWAIGGLEATLYAGAILLGYAKHFDAPPQASEGFRIAAKRSWPLALACLTRPDGPLFVVVLVASELFCGKLSLNRLRAAFFTAWWPFAAFCAQLTFRLSYYGEWVPNTAHIKANTDADRAMHGVLYLQDAFANAGMLVLFALGAWLILRKSKEQRAIVTSILAALLWSGYIASVGGDIFPAWRHALISYVLLLYCGSFALGSLFSEAKTPFRAFSTPSYSAALVGLCSAIALAQAQRSDRGNERAATERWEWDAASLGPLYRRFKPTNPLMAVEPAGALPFFSQLATVDMYGLCDAHISRQEPDRTQRLAHEYGDGEYIWSRKPDLILFSLPTGGGPRSSSGAEITKKPTFQQLYKEARFKAVDPVGTKGKLHVRKDGKVGIVRGPNSIYIPGYLLNSPDLFGYAIGEHGVGARLKASGSARSDSISLDPGVWKIVVQQANAPFSLKISNQGEQALDWQTQEQHWLVSNATKIQLELVAPSSQSLSFMGLSLERVATELPPGSSTLLPKQNALLAGPGVSVPRVPLDPLPGPKHFEDEGQAIINEEIPVHAACGQQLPGLNQEIRLDTYETDEKDEWTGTLKGPIYRLPQKAVAYACISGGSYNAGLRLRSLDSGKVIASWSGHNSARLSMVRENLSEFAGQTVQFEAYDSRINAWGHIRVFGLGIVAPPSHHGHAAL